MDFIFTALRLLWGLLSKYPMQALILSLLLTIGWMRLDLHWVRTDLETAKKDNAAFVVANKALNGQITDQNKSITDLKAANLKYAGQIQDSIKTAEALQASTNKQLADMKKKITPKSCDGAMQRLLDDAIARQHP